MKKAPERFVSSTRCQFSTVTSRKGVSSSTPALFTRTSIRPQRFVATSTAAWHSSGLETSAWHTHAFPSPQRTVAAAASICSSVRATSMTSAPSEAKRSAVARPIPRPPPVTMTFRPSNLLMSSPFHGARCQAPDEEALAEEVEDDHRERREHHPRHRHRDVEVEARAEHSQPDHERLQLVARQEDERDQELVPDEERVDEDERHERRHRER